MYLFVSNSLSVIYYVRYDNLIEDGEEHPLSHCSLNSIDSEIAVHEHILRTSQETLKY